MRHSQFVILVILFIVQTYVLSYVEADEKSGTYGKGAGERGGSRKGARGNAGFRRGAGRNEGLRGTSVASGGPRGGGGAGGSESSSGGTVGRYTGGQNVPKPFSFSYRVRDEKGNVHYRQEHRDENGNVKGSYGYTDVDSVYRVVEYVADANGFRATIRTNEPGVGKDSPADVALTAEAPPAAVVDRYAGVGRFGGAGSAGRFGGGASSAGRFGGGASSAGSFGGGASSAGSYSSGAGSAGGYSSGAGSAGGYSGGTGSAGGYSGGAEHTTPRSKTFNFGR